MPFGKVEGGSGLEFDFGLKKDLQYVNRVKSRVGREK
jgi:hypothetical protein